MVSYLYRRHGRLLLALVALSFPYFYLQSESIPNNNDIETWLPRDTGVRTDYEQFKRDFGAEEVIVVGINRPAATPHLLEAVAGRIERIRGIRSCWTPDRVTAQMESLGVAPDVAAERIRGLLTSTDGPMQGVIALLDPYGIGHRAEVVEQIQEQLRYCRLDGRDTALTGAPVIVTELDHLGSQKVSRKFFAVTCMISLGLLYLVLRHLGMALSTLGITLWGIYVTQTVLYWCGGEMNFIMGSLSVMTMIFTLSIAVHFVSYYSAAKQRQAADPLAAALRDCWKPTSLSTITTLLGLMSLGCSSILPVAQFGYAAALGAVIALLVGLGVMPALTIIWPDCSTRSFAVPFDLGKWSDWLAQRRYQVLTVGGLGLMIMAFGVLRLKSDVDPVEFLPKRSVIFSDLQRIEAELTNIDSIEAVVTFTDTELPFFERLRQVRALEQQIGAHPGVRHVMSAASFFPEEMPDSTFEVAGILSRANAMQSDSGWVALDQRLWRISARVRRSAEFSPIEILADLDEQLAGAPIRFTGLTPLLKSAQHEIFAGFWESFTAACLTISLVMILSLRSIVAGLIAMIPNIVPIWLVFGGVGYLGMPVDIGMMMTGSIALGISVDCTFHFLVHYREAYAAGKSSVVAVREALEHSGAPMIQSTLICSLGMLALCFSSFEPTARFGALMSAQMLVSMLGELALLPALLCCRPALKLQTTKDTAADLSAAADVVVPQAVAATAAATPIPAPHLPLFGAANEHRGHPSSQLADLDAAIPAPITVPRRRGLAPEAT